VKVAVIGAGVTGLTAAWRLTQAGHEVRVLEASQRPGGFVRTEASGGWLFEAGPNSFLESPESARFLRDAGLSEERVESSPQALNRYVVLRGRLVAFPRPDNLAALVSTPLFSLGAKLRITAEAGRKPAERAADISVADLVREHFGAEVLDRVVQPFVGGIFAGDPERLSAKIAFPKIWEAERTTGSLVRAGMAGARGRRESGLPAAASVVSFRSGLRALPSALASRLRPGSLVCGARVRSVSAAVGGRWHVLWEGAAPGAEEFGAVIAAVPAWALADLEVGGPGERPLAALAGAEHPPIASVFLGFRRGQVSHPLDGFGALVPAAEKRSVLGIIFSSSLFPGRAPEGHVAVTAIVGGALQPERARADEGERLSRTLHDVRELLGASGEPVFARQACWDRSIPQYNLGYGDFLEAISRAEESLPRFYVGGIARDGISLPDAIASGERLAKRVS
jgi:oxygen-dependent protoporphyrinogen oxidase